MQGRGWWESEDSDGLWHLFLPHFNLGLGGGYRSKVVVVGELLPWPCPYGPPSSFPGDVWEGTASATTNGLDWFGWQSKCGG